MVVMDILSNLALGFSVALTLHNLLLCFVGVLTGTLIGVLPGVGPIATIAMPRELRVRKRVRQQASAAHLDAGGLLTT
jgi:hypothetical protein